MSTENPSIKGPPARRNAIVAVAAVVVIAAVLLGITQFSSSPLPVVAANYRCLPPSQIPQLKAGDHATVTASYGGFTATFYARLPTTYASGSGGQDFGMPFKGTLKIKGAGQSWTLPKPANTFETQINAMCVIAFQRERHPGVMVEGFTGGAHCCEVPLIYLYNATTHRYVKVVDLSSKNPNYSYVFDHNGGLIPKVVGHQVLLRTGDDAFAYAFGCYACSALPIVLYSVDPDGLADVTSRHASLVKADATAIWKSAAASLRAEDTATSSLPAPFGYLAPWVADECSIGRGRSAWPVIDRLQTEGELSDALYHRATLNSGSFMTSLRFFLLKDGYCTGEI